jgi:hypothetical protein
MSPRSGAAREAYGWDDLDGEALNRACTYAFYISRSIANLGRSLAWGAALCAAAERGVWEGTLVARSMPAQWWPLCGRTMPGWEG